MPERRILSLWFPRLGAERILRRMAIDVDAPFAVVSDTGQMQSLCALNAAAEDAGLHIGQSLSDAYAICSTLLTRPQNIQGERALLDALARWAGQFSPWVAQKTPDALILDITGCAHLFGGEKGLMTTATQAAQEFGLTARCGLASTVGAAWALARYAGVGPDKTRSGDAIDQEARATRSRAAKRRHWERGGAAPLLPSAQPTSTHPRIAPPGQAHNILSKLPVAALRLDPKVVTDLNRLGLRRIGDLLAQPRGPLARRFGRGLVLRLDQAMGVTPEPVSPGTPSPRFATRITLPDPIGLSEDIIAAVDRLVPHLCALLKNKGQGARHLCLQGWRSDGTMGQIEIGLARATHQPEPIRALIGMRIEELDAGYGIDMMRLEATVVEHVHNRMISGHLSVENAISRGQDKSAKLEDLMARVGGRIGLDAITRYHPVSSHIPEKTAQVQAAAWSKPANTWPRPNAPRPLLIWRPEPVIAADIPHMPDQFRWRGRTHMLRHARGPERISPEWWLDEPDWRSGVRDYWHVITTRGERLWLYYAHGGTMSSGWFCQGVFA